MASEFLQPLDQILSATVEVFVDGLQPLGSNGLHSHQGPLDMRRAHGIQKLGIFRSFHRYLGEENHIFGQCRQARHQLKTFLPNSFQLRQSLRIILPLGQLHVGERDGVEIVIGQSNKTITEPAKLNNFSYHCVRRPLSWFLAVGTPHRAKGAVLRTSPHSLHRRPHVPVSRQEVPTRRFEFAGAYPSAFVNTFGRARTAIVERLSPSTVAIAFYHGMGSTLVKGFLRVQSGMDAAEDYGGAALAGLSPKAIATQGITSVNSYPHHVAWSDAHRIQMLQSLITNNRIAK